MLGAKKHLEQHDLWDVAPQHDTLRLFKRYERAMKQTARTEKFPHVRTFSAGAADMHACAHGDLRLKWPRLTGDL
jgi:hypothetical protein